MEDHITVIAMTNREIKDPDLKTSFLRSNILLGRQQKNLFTLIRFVVFQKDWGKSKL